MNYSPRVIGIIPAMLRAALVALLLLAPTVVAAAPCTEPYTTLFERVSPAVVSIQAMRSSLGGTFSPAI